VTDDILRAAEHHEVMAKIGAPKPQPRLKRTRAGKYARAKLPNPKRDQEDELEAWVRKIVWRRDAGVCVCAATDGQNCGGEVQWGHYLDRAQSGWFTFTLVTFCQCSNHNKIHRADKEVMKKALTALLGAAWVKHIEVERRVHKNNKVWETDIAERLERYQRLWDNWPAVYTVRSLLLAGYYE